MDYGQQTTGTRDEHYNLISVLYHVLHGAENCDRYAADAEITGDERLAAFFREAQTMHTQVAERAKGLLGILEPPPEFGVEPETISGSVPPQTSGYPANDVSPTTDVPRTPPQDVRRGTTPDAPIIPPGESVPPYVAPPPGGEPPSREKPPTRGGEAIEAGGGANAADPAGRTATGRGETRQAYPTVAPWRHRLLYRIRGPFTYGQDAL